MIRDNRTDPSGSRSTCAVIVTYHARVFAAKCVCRSSQSARYAPKGSRSEPFSPSPDGPSSGELSLGPLPRVP